MRILFLEDELTARFGLVTLLKGRGHVVDEVATADNALAKLKTYRYDLLILDIILDQASKEMSGIPLRELGKELLVRLRAKQLGGLATETGVPVVVLTAVADQGITGVITQIPNTLVLYKPIDPEDSLYDIESFLAQLKGGHKDA